MRLISVIIRGQMDKSLYTTSPCIKRANFLRDSLIYVNKIIYFVLHIFLTCLLRLSFLENIFKQMEHTNSDFDLVSWMFRFLLFGIIISVSSVSSIRSFSSSILEAYSSSKSPSRSILCKFCFILLM